MNCVLALMAPFSIVEAESARQVNRGCERLLEGLGRYRGHRGCRERIATCGRHDSVP